MSPSTAARRYFFSGWAFLVPYLAAYLLYYWARWPVNPGSNPSFNSGGPHVPCLLHLYWALHGINLILAAIALCVGQRDPAASKSSGIPIPARPKCGAIGLALLPWVLLALLFYIPGVYLEFPADPWAHYSRINEWAQLHLVTEHSTWAKSSYFLAYSLLGQICPPTRQLFWLDYYYTGICLLLCWQYYRLGRAAGLSPRFSTFFVILQTLFFGNNIFGFYRYYGISSSIFAQLGAIALIRVATEIAGRTTSRGGGQRDRAPLLWPITSAFCLVLIIVFNHIQGLGVASLGLAAVAIWRLIEWKRPAIWWLMAAMLVMSVFAILWIPRDPAIDQIYRSQGWLTGWYGFNIFAADSPAFDRAMWTLGFLGILNLGAGVFLLRHNRLVGWLTVLPVIALGLPFIAIPLAGAILRYNPEEGVITFSRMLFAIPPGLAIATVLDGTMGNAGPNLISIVRRLAFPAGMIALAALLVIPPHRPWYNHFYNEISISPGDLSMRRVVAAAGVLPSVEISAAVNLETINSKKFIETAGIVATPGIGYVLESTGKAVQIPWAERRTWPIPASAAGLDFESLRGSDPHLTHAMPFSAVDNLYTAYSPSALLSGHWLANEVALEYGAQEELLKRPTLASRESPPPQLWLEWIGGPAGTRFFGSGTDRPVRGFSEYRGDIGLPAGFADPALKPRLILMPVFRTLNGAGWRVALTVTGPNAFRQFHEDRRWPKPSGVETWLYFYLETRFDFPGTYTIKIEGDAAWPSKHYEAAYTLTVPGNRDSK